MHPENSNSNCTEPCSSLMHDACHSHPYMASQNLLSHLLMVELGLLVNLRLLNLRLLLHIVVCCFEQGALQLCAPAQTPPRRRSWRRKWRCMERMAVLHWSLRRARPRLRPALEEATRRPRLRRLPLLQERHLERRSRSGWRRCWRRLIVRLIRKTTQPHRLLPRRQ